MGLLKNLDNMTAEELFKKHSNLTSLSEGHYDYMIDKDDFKKGLIEFAKYHVEQALTEASKTTIWKEEPTTQGCKISFVKSKILNAYPLENVK